MTRDLSLFLSKFQPKNMNQKDAIQLSVFERDRQDARFGAMPRNHDCSFWAFLIAEELEEAVRELTIDRNITDQDVIDALAAITHAGKLARAVLGEGGRDILKRNIMTHPSSNYLNEMVQVSALAIAAIEDAPEPQ